MPRVLFVCLGNICRSPTAEGVLRHLAAAEGVDVEIDSAGTADWNLGKPPYGPAVRAARARGIDLSGLRARQVGPDDFDRFDLIVAMDRKVEADLEALRPAGNSTPLRRMTSYLPGSGPDVPDPYVTGDFFGVLDLIDGACWWLLEDLASASP